jgi:hypothetical protein
MTDYEEQTTITGVKYGVHCTICHVEQQDREDLDGTWPPRTHESMREQIRKQEEYPDKFPPSHADWVQSWPNFAWEHDRTNIHAGMMIDKLHQLYKGIVKYTMVWLHKAAEPLLRKRRGGGQERSILDCSYVEQLDYRFKQVPPYPGLKLFNNTAFSKVKQWTGNEQKALIRQLAPVMAPILTSHHPNAMKFLRAVMDFVTLAEYRSHDEETLGYMEHALNRINKMKEEFRDLRPKDRVTQEGHFNFPKFHVLTHYVSFIRKYGSLDGFDSAYPETGHKIQVKEPYKRTNKRDGFEEQVFDHVIRANNMAAMMAIYLSRLRKPVSAARSRLAVPVNHKSRAIDLFTWDMEPEERAAHALVRKEKRAWRPASTIARHTKLDDFIDALAVFVREMRRINSGRPLQENFADEREKESGISYRREKDPSWVNTFPLSIHPSMICWTQRGSNPAEPQGVEKQYVRCVDNWQSTEQPRRDFVWITEFPDDDYMKGMVLGQLRLIFTIQDIAARSDGEFPEYTGCVLDTMSIGLKGQPHHVHGMYEFEKRDVVSPEQRRRAIKLGARRIYSASKVLRLAHVVPADLVENRTYLVNNYSDFEAFNTLYSPSWRQTATKDADRIQEEAKKRRATTRAQDYAEEDDSASDVDGEVSQTRSILSRPCGQSGRKGTSRPEALKGDSRNTKIQKGTQRKKGGKGRGHPRRSTTN